LIGTRVDVPVAARAPTTYLEPMQARTLWLLYSVLGLLLVGAGVSIVGEAVIRKAVAEPWFMMGTVGLVVLNSGVSVFGQAIVYRLQSLNDAR
jgi:hypothetical protein